MVNQMLSVFSVNTEPNHAHKSLVHEQSKLSIQCMTYFLCKSYVPKISMYNYRADMLQTLSVFSTGAMWHQGKIYSYYCVCLCVQP